MWRAMLALTEAVPGKTIGLFFSGVDCGLVHLLRNRQKKTPNPWLLVVIVIALMSACWLDICELHPCGWR